MLVEATISVVKPPHVGAGTSIRAEARHETIAAPPAAANTSETALTSAGRVVVLGPGDAFVTGEIDIRRSGDQMGVFGNPLLMHGEAQRDAVVDGYGELLRGASTPEQIARTRGLPPPHAKSTRTPPQSRLLALSWLAERARKGETLWLRCGCSPSRCHGDAIASWISTRCAQADDVASQLAVALPPSSPSQPPALSTGSRFFSLAGGESVTAGAGAAAAGMMAAAAGMMDRVGDAEDSQRDSDQSEASDDSATSEASTDQVDTTDTGWAKVLIVFAGPGSERDLAAHLRARGLHVVAIDTKQGGEQHNVLRPQPRRHLLDAVRRGDFTSVFIATPCQSYSIAHRPQLRSRRQPLGLQNTPSEWARYLGKHNELAQFTADLVAAAHAAGASWVIENPADRGDRRSPAFWEKHADHAPLWLQPAVATAIAGAAGAREATFAQCAFGATTQKWTTVAYSSDLEGLLAPLRQRPCDHGATAHDGRAHGRAADGSSLSAASAAYPLAMNAFLASALTARARERREEEGQHQLSRGAAAALGGGRVADGPRLGPGVARACEEARHRPPRFASMRNRRPASLESLRHEAFPVGMHWPAQAPSKPKGKPRPHMRPPQPGAEEHAVERAERIRAGSIAIGELYLDGVYDGIVTPWLQLADRAAKALKEGRTPPAVPTRTIGQEQMRTWAQGVVWNCSDPLDCKLVTPSTRHTTFKGGKQIDRAAFRAVAAALDWHDRDIVSQVGEGGIESRSDCPLDTVLAFHHLGLIENVDAAERAVATDIAEQWVDQPIRHLPFVPCRLLPRNVVMQERSRLVPSESGGEPTLELYPKPRVTQDSSNGGDRSVNAGVPDHECWVELPTVQQFGRGIAICDTAGDDATRVGSYVVDAQSAYRYCPTQEADLWQQCFLWWDAEGSAGICVDRRTAFGGSFAPNRFERISTMVVAHIRTKQAAFDEAQPPPPAARRWMSERRAAQARGELPNAHVQAMPSHLQVYIDDFMGTALDDPVTEPDEVRGISIGPEQVRSEGGTAASPSTRVYVHAQLTVAGLRDVGLDAAPHKVVAGDPVIGLGLRIDRAARRIDCPPLKRASMLADLAKQAEAAREALEVDRDRAETLVGRLVNISQILPELKSVLHGGYAITKASWQAGGRRRRLRRMRLRTGSSAQTDWLGLLAVAAELLELNVGVALAPELSFPALDELGMDTVTTDASGIDGVGGYLFDANSPGEVWLVSEKWPADIQAALDRAAETGTVPTGGGSLSMPAAELFGIIAVADAVASERGRRATAITAIGDCAPAAAALNAATSPTAQMRSILREAGQLTTLWLGVAVPRELNVDADRLSHPTALADGAGWRIPAAVVADAEAASLSVRRAHITPEMWEALRRAVALGTGALTRGDPPEEGRG